MMRIARLLPALLACLWPVRAADLLVAAASDIAPMTAALEAGFAKTSGQRVRFTLASSGSLARQIENGAPFDVFLSASDIYVNGLSAGGFLDRATVVTYGYGRVALWSANGSARSLDDLKQPEVRHIAIPNPQHAPYGLAARQILESRGLWKSLEPKIVYGENVRQALQFAQSRNAEAVLTSWTLLKGKGILLPAEWHAPIRQTGAVVKASSQAQAARGFLQFLQSPEGKKILQDGGLITP
jgi:molybdate transport system substrate-binding protein